MAHTTDPAASVVDQETLIQGVAKHFVQKVFGLEGMPWGTKFSDLEELAVQIGQAVSQLSPGAVKPRDPVELVRPRPTDEDIGSRKSLPFQPRRHRLGNRSRRAR